MRATTHAVQIQANADALHNAIIAGDLYMVDAILAELQDSIRIIGCELNLDTLAYE